MIQADLSISAFWAGGDMVSEKGPENSLTGNLEIAIFSNC
jgi:hypothetical protein